MLSKINNILQYYFLIVAIKYPWLLKLISFLIIFLISNVIINFNNSFDINDVTPKKSLDEEHVVFSNDLSLEIFESAESVLESNVKPIELLEL